MATHIIIPEPKRLLPHPLPPTSSKSERASPDKDHGISRELPAFPQFHWPAPFYAGFPQHYHYLPYRFPGFPLTALPEGFPISPYQDHISTYAAHGAVLAPFPLMQGVSQFQLPFPVRQAKCCERDSEKITKDTSEKSAFQAVNGSSKVNEGPLDLASPRNKPQPLPQKKHKDGDHAKYQCSDCQKTYSTFSGLSKHKQFHCSQEMNKEFTCKYCDKTYVSLGALKMHIRTHTLPCKCKICGKAFSRPWLLQGHIRTHTGEKPFSCVHCLRAFADRSNLRAHLQTHSDVKKYSCKSCSKTFSRMSLLLKHEEACTCTMGMV